MTTAVDIINRALQAIGTRTTITAAELAALSSNEAIQAALVYEEIRDDLLRMAPWDCCTTAANLSIQSAAPGTPENPAPSTLQWRPGQPLPPWLYSYSYPSDCLRALYIVPQFGVSFSGIPITTVTTGFSPNYGSGGPIRFKVAVDPYLPYATGDFNADFNSDFDSVLNPAGDQKVILTNQQQACLMYCRQIVNPNIMDTLFIRAWINALAGTLAMVLTGDKSLANMKIQQANQAIAEARAIDANEGLTVNDVTPDFMRIRGVDFADRWQQGGSFDWGNDWSFF